MHQIAKSKLKRYQKAQSHRENFVDMFQDAYDYTLPMREGFYYEEAGQRRDDKIFDSTAVNGIQEFASRLQSAMVPNFSRWADFVAGSEIPPDQKDAVNNQLDEVTDYVFEVLQNSNFAQEVHESFMDLAVGTGVLCIEEGDSVNPVIFTSVPLPRIVLDTGPNNNVDHIFRERKRVPFDELSILYPDATFDPKVMANMGKDRETSVLEIVCKDYSKLNEEAYYHYAICMTTETLLYEKRLTGLGSNPFVCFRWSPAANEVYGRGPIVNALPAIKVANLTVQLILENAQMAISGIYQAEDDGVMNLDTINLVPGTVIPKAMGSAGLQPIQSAGRFDVGQLQLNEMRMEIRKFLYMDMLGDPDKTPASATEVAERMADLNRRMSATFGRLQSELIQPVLQRVIYILKKQGRIELPTINGREVKVRSVSPLAQGQANEDIARIARFLETINNYLGPQLVPVLIDPEQTAVVLAEKFGVPDSLIRDEEQRRQITAMMQQIAQQQGADVGSQS